MKALIHVSEASEDPVSDKNLFFSVELAPGELSAAIAIKDARPCDRRFDIEGVLILPKKSPLQGDRQRIEAEFSSLEEFIAYFGGMLFKPAKAYEAIPGN